MWCLEKISVVVSVYAMNSTGPTETLWEQCTESEEERRCMLAVKTWVHAICKIRAEPF